MAARDRRVYYGTVGDRESQITTIILIYDPIEKLRS